MQAEIDQFKQYLSHRYPDRSTTKHYTSDMAIFCEFVGAISPKEVTIKTIDLFVKMQSEQGLKPATINRRLSTISSFFEYLISEHEEEQWHNPVHWRRHSIRPGQHIPRDVSENTVEALLAVIEDKRDRAMVMLMVGAGLRIGEVVGLEMSDIGETDASNLCRLRVHGKGDKERVVWLTQEIQRQMQIWLAERPPSKNSQVFLNQHGRPLSVSGVQFRLNQYCQSAGVQLTAHQLRHTFARRLVEHNLPVESLAKLLGHNQLTTTQRYIDGADPILRADFLQAIARIQIVSAPESALPPDPRGSTLVPATKNTEERPNLNALMSELQHLTANLPDWLREPMTEHTLRRASRWPDHRLKAQLHMHFSSLCRTGRWLIQNRNWHQLDGLQRTDLVAYIHARQAEGWKPRSIATQLTIFRMFWRDLLAEERVSNGAVLQVKAPVADAPLPRYLTISEYQQLEKVVQQATAQNLPEDRFNQAWFYILAHAGLRLSEVRNLRLADCDLIGKRLRVCAGKGNRDRVIPMTEKLNHVLQAYLAVREPTSSNHLLIYRQFPVKGTLIPDRLERWGKEAGIQPMTPHRLRHTLATMLINQGMPIASLQKLLGHQDINKTMIYARVYDQTVKEQFSNAMKQIESIPVMDWPHQMIELESTAHQTPDSV
jgi:site-specific recombinase XerD